MTPASSDTDGETDATTQSLETGQAGSDTAGNGATEMAYRVVLLAVVLLGSMAVLVGVGGTFLVLTGGTGDEQTADVLGEFACDSFEADPQVVHKTDYEVETRVLSPAQVTQFNATADGQRVRLSVTTEGPLLAASANTQQGRPITVETRDDEASFVRNSTEPFRLWVDSVSAEGTVTRMQLDICPPAS